MNKLCQTASDLVYPKTGRYLDITHNPPLSSITQVVELNCYLILTYPHSVDSNLTSGTINRAGHSIKTCILEDLDD